MAQSTILCQARRRLAHQLAQVQRRGFVASSRCYKTTAAEAASYLLENFTEKSVVRRQFIDGNQLQKLLLTLGQTSIEGADVSEAAPVAGTPVPQGYHLAYFTPNGTEKELGADGTDRTFNASAPFTRRMWAGGKMKWPAPSSGALLRVGDEVEERTRLVSAIAKKSRSAGEMVLVEVEKEFLGPNGLALVDRRSWVFRPEIDPETAPPAPKPLADVTRGPSSVIDFTSNGDGEISRDSYTIVWYANTPRLPNSRAPMVSCRPLQILGPHFQWPYDSLQRRLDPKCREPCWLGSSWPAKPHQPPELLEGCSW